MSFLYYLVLLLVLHALKQPVDQASAHGQLVMPPLNVIGPSYRTCRPEAIDGILQQIRTNVSDILSEHIIPECGDGLSVWYRVAYLNMTDPSQQCLPAWREYNSNKVRACGRPVSQNGSCSPSTFYLTTQQYSRVCGRATGYQVGNPDGFSHLFATHVININEGYVDCVSITHGEPRQHIWSYVAGHSERRPHHKEGNCPCSPQQGSAPPSFVGNNYYCESGNPADSSPSSKFYRSDQLWDGEQCEGTCCSGTTKSPPWFSVQLPTNTTDRIEVRICGDESTSNEDVIIELLEIFVQ